MCCAEAQNNAACSPRTQHCSSMLEWRLSTVVEMFSLNCQYWLFIIEKKKNKTVCLGFFLTNLVCVCSGMRLPYRDECTKQTGARGRSLSIGESEIWNPALVLRKPVWNRTVRVPRANLVTQSEIALMESHVGNFSPGDQSDVAIRERWGVRGW